MRDHPVDDPKPGELRQGYHCRHGIMEGECPACAPANNDGGGFGKRSNPKDALGSARIDLSHLSPFAMVEESLAYEEGLCKYGRNNYRIAGIRAMIYIGAALRHIWKYVMGEQRDPRTNVHHLGSARACLGILLDAEGYGKLTDDRPPSPKGFSEWLDGKEAEVKHLREIFKDRNPCHWTITDDAQ